MPTKILSVFCVLFIFLSSCRKGNEKEISLFNDFKFVTDSTEHLADRDSMAQKRYTSYFNNMEQVQIPLYRVIEGKGYSIYLGIPFHATLKKLVKFRREQPMADTVQAFNENDHSFYRSFIRDSFYLTEYVRALDSASIICIYAVSKDSVVANTVLSEEKLNARIFK